MRNEEANVLCADCRSRVVCSAGPGQRAQHGVLPDCMRKRNNNVFSDEYNGSVASALCACNGALGQLG